MQEDPTSAEPDEADRATGKQQSVEVRDGEQRSKGKSPGSDESLVLARVREGDRHGYIDRDGEYVIDPRFSMAYPFRGGYADVISGGKSMEDFSGDLVFGGDRYLIDPSGEPASDPYGNGLWHGNALVIIEGRPGVSSRTIRSLDGEIIASGFEEIGEFREGRAVAVRDGRIGWIDTRGKWSSSFSRGEQIEKLCPVHSGLACAVVPGESQRCGWMDPETGEWVLSPKYLSCGHFSNGRAFASLPKHDRYGVIDRSGRWIATECFDDYLDFSESRAFVKVNGLGGIIDRDGDWVVEPRFAQGSQFSEGLGLFRSADNGLLGFVNRNGEVVVEPQFDLARWFHHGLAIASRPQDDKVGFINRSGQFVIEPKFESAHSFGDVDSLRNDY